MKGRILLCAASVLALGVLTACSSTPAAPPSARPATATAHQAAAFSNWTVGARPLPRQADGYGEIEPTPPQLVVRRLPSTDFLPPPADGRFHDTIGPVPAAVLARSTWQPSCPVRSDQLRYLTMSFWGFDGKPHTGEMIVNASVADAVPTVFAQLFAAHFPIEEMRVASMADENAAPTGDGNDTTSFVCRPVVGQTNWSAHAYGLAIDLDPFCNPYVDGSLVVPELASSYLNRGYVRPGMVEAGDATVRAFAAIGWSWGGAWTVPKDIMHFTATGH